MLNWFLSFLHNGGVSNFTDIGFTIAFCDLIVSTFFDIAFHGLLRFRVGVNRKELESAANDLNLMHNL